MRVSPSCLHLAAVKASEGTLAVYVGDGVGGLTLDQNYFLGVFPLAIDLGDLDGDGDLDAVSSHLGSGRFEVHENRGDGFLSRLPISLTAPTAAFAPFKKCLPPHTGYRQSWSGRQEAQPDAGADEDRPVSPGPRPPAAPSFGTPVHALTIPGN